MKKQFNFLGVSMSVINQQEAERAITGYSFTAPGYICFPDASVVKEASKDQLLTDILNNALLTMPDGKPSQLAARLQGFKNAGTVSGYHLCNMLLNTGLRHYFYGGSEAILEKVKSGHQARFPNAAILGYKAPPFVSLQDIHSDSRIKEDIDIINSLQPDLVWIGISSPKQDYLMHYFHKNLDRSLMLGVGGVFLYYADESLKSPEFLKKLGLRWAYRLWKEPRRLWPKYFGTFTFLFRNSGYFIKAFFSSRI